MNGLKAIEFMINGGTVKGTGSFRNYVYKVIDGKLCYKHLEKDNEWKEKTEFKMNKLYEELK